MRSFQSAPLRCLFVLVSFAATLLAPFALAQAPLDLETAVPADWSAASGGLSISSNHSKIGTQSLQWSWTANDVLSVTNANISAANACVAWIYNPSALPGQKLTFAFKDAGGTTQYTFDYFLDYAGWRRAVRNYSDMTGLKANTSIATVTITAPAGGSGQLFLDSVLWAGSAGVTVIKDGQNLASTNTYFYRPFYEVTPDIAKTTPTAEELAALNAIRASYAPGSPGSMTSTYQSWTDLNIQVTGPNPWDIKSVPVDVMADPTWVRTLGQDVYANQTPESISKMNLFMRNFLDQGGAGGSEALQMGRIQRNWFLGEGMALANRSADASLRPQVWDALRWSYRMGRYWDTANAYPGIGFEGSLDNIGTYWSSWLPQHTKAVLFGPPDDATAWQYLKGFSRYWADWTLAPNDGSAGGVKVDGTGFHHGAAYPAYMGQLIDVYSPLLRMTHPGLISPTGYANMRNGILSQMRYTVAGKIPNSMSGRHPFSVGTFFGASEVQKLGIIGGQVLGLPGPDPIVAQAYNSYYPGSPYAPFASYGPDTNGMGFYQFNHALSGMPL